MRDRGKSSANLAANKKYLFTFLGSTVVLYGVYRTLLGLFPARTIPILIVFMSAATALTLFYIIYNRGMSRKNLTPDMLPDTMSETEKTEFIEDGKKRLARSKIILSLILAFFMTFILDLAEMYISARL